MNIEGRSLLSIEETAHALGLANSTVRAMLASGEVGSVKIGKRRLVPVDAVSIYVDRLKAEAGSARAMKAVA